ncbi:hypothetical protein BDN72DRAFT_441920 [Pluteus cervinus]|uniref:Uncharacterized protein n=1 Tax=Pluteus cervinus TaxID=181527 RepID=A0ACD3BBX8_9AGAR|nr:hypothetical protein BDN72DRAFT_441920 [Pluteus cervinus]
MTTLPNTNPPLYSAYVPAPDYSRLPSSGEQRLQATPTTRATPKGTVVKKDRHITVILEDQCDNAVIPTYSRGAAVRGFIIIDGLTSLAEVSVKINGRLEATSTKVGVVFFDVIADTHNIWSSNNPENDLFRNTSPGPIPFCIRLRSSYKYDGADHPLPPTFHAAVSGVPGLYVDISYSLTFSVTGVKRRQIGHWNQTKRLDVPFRYHPRMQPPGPIMRTADFFSAVKLSPDGWHQSVGVVEASGDFKPIELHFFIPSDRVFGVKDIIQFHIQLIGPIRSLRELFLPPPRSDPLTKSSSNNVWTPFNQHNTTGKMSKSPTSKDEDAPPILQVSLVRQVSIEVDGARAWKNLTIGEGTVLPLPPPINWLESDLKVDPSRSTNVGPPPVFDGTSLDREESLDWGGEIQVIPEDTGSSSSASSNKPVGSFSAGGVVVRDFIVVSAVPPKSRRTWQELRLPVSIRLVSDSYIDIPPEF